VNGAGRLAGHAACGRCRAHLSSSLIMDSVTAVRPGSGSSADRSSSGVGRAASSCRRKSAVSACALTDRLAPSGAPQIEPSWRPASEDLAPAAATRGWRAVALGAQARSIQVGAARAGVAGWRGGVGA
jgi:hypothetical protein